MAFRMFDAVTAIGASKAIKLAATMPKDHLVEVFANQNGATAFSALTISLQGSAHNLDADTGVITNPALVVGSTPERFANGAFDFQIGNTTYRQAADAVGAQFSAAHVISASKWGAIDIFINAAGAFSSVVPLATQAYNTAALAMAAADATIIDAASYSRLASAYPYLAYTGRILIQNNAGAWTANTDDLTTGGSDLTSATFISAIPSFQDLVTYVFTADDITNHRAWFQMNHLYARFMRLYLSVLTGSVSVTAWFTMDDNP